MEMDNMEFDNWCILGSGELGNFQLVVEFCEQ